MMRERGALTKLHILYEISKRDKHIRQRNMAEHLNVTVQAVSENIRSLIKEGYITSKNGRSPYSLTLKGIDKIKEEATELKRYSGEILESVDYFRSVWPAIASENLKEGDNVGIYMDDGILHAIKKRKSANAVTLTDGLKNEDIALKNLNGTVDIEESYVVVIDIPTIKDGGSKATNLDLIKKTYDSGLKNWNIDKSFNRVGILGTVGYSVCLKLKIPVDIEFAVTKSAIEASKKGLNVLLLVVGKMSKKIIKELEDNKVNYYFLDAHYK
ncbi:MAG: winged helix-turn-helix transcriptional regulator [Methanobrevibacter sp.]|jgi:putative transcriptional regulator|nr:winged helix-turn-helix transcriptional regulator [Candidatus Methanovirga meridionalis]